MAALDVACAETSRSRGGDTGTGGSESGGTSGAGTGGSGGASADEAMDRLCTSKSTRQSCEAVPVQTDAEAERVCRWAVTLDTGRPDACSVDDIGGQCVYVFSRPSDGCGTKPRCGENESLGDLKLFLDADHPSELLAVEAGCGDEPRSESHGWVECSANPLGYAGAPNDNDPVGGCACGCEVATSIARWAENH